MIHAPIYPFLSTTLLPVCDADAIVGACRDATYIQRFQDYSYCTPMALMCIAVAAVGWFYARRPLVTRGGEK